MILSIQFMILPIQLIILPIQLMILPIQLMALPIQLLQITSFNSKPKESTESIKGRPEQWKVRQIERLLLNGKTLQERLCNGNTKILNENKHHYWLDILKKEKSTKP